MTSLSTTGVPEAAMVWAICPPMVPAPTTAALNTNMAPQAIENLRVQLPPRCGSAAACAERLALRAPDEQQVHHGHPGPLILQRVAQLEGDRDGALDRREGHALGAAQLLVLDVDGLALARDVARHTLLHAPASAGLRVPQHARAGPRPIALQSRDVVQAVDEGRPAGGVVPQLLGLAGEAGDDDAGAHATHRAATTAARGG